MFETIPLLESGAGIPTIVLIAAIFYFLNKIANNIKPPSPPTKQLPKKKEFHWWD